MRDERREKIARRSAGTERSRRLARRVGAHAQRVAQRQLGNRRRDARGSGDGVSGRRRAKHHGFTR